MNLILFYEQIKINCQSNYIYAIDKFYLWLRYMYKNFLDQCSKGGAGYGPKGAQGMGYSGQMTEDRFLVSVF